MTELHSVLEAAAHEAGEVPALHLIVATAGHVDHGKSTLVQALTGVDPDRLPEEKARGLTIELGFAHLELSAPSGTAAFSVGIVDVPGHEDFVKNMVAGVGSIDAALFVVAADDGWMPQSEEHLEILLYLGVERAVVALTKVDIVPEARRRGLTDDLRRRLADTPFANAAIVATNAAAGQGLDELRTALAAMFVDTPVPEDIGKPRLAVDRVFTIDGAGTVVTGTLSGGHLQEGQAVLIQPGGCKSRVRAIQSHNRGVEDLAPGTRAALNLADVTPGRDIHRGDVVATAACGKPGGTIDVHLTVSERMIDLERSDLRPLRDDTRVRIHHGSGNVSARLYLLSAKELLPGDTAVAQLRLEEPMLACVGDRFIVRDCAERMTLAGGQILDAAARRTGLRAAERRSRLEELVDAGGDIGAHVAFEVAKAGATCADDLLTASRFARAALTAATERLCDAGAILAKDGWYVAAAVWTRALEVASGAVDQFHAAHAELKGIDLSELRAHVKPSLPDEALFEVLVADLCASGFDQGGSVLRRSSHEVRVPAHLKEGVDRVSGTLARAAFDPPARKELVRDKMDEQALRYLLEAGEAILVSAELPMGSSAYRDAIERIETHIRAHGPATVSDLRTALNSSRRVMVPLLERLDSDGVTVRDGDKRKLRKA